jgi:hypothetical protein
MPVQHSAFISQHSLGVSALDDGIEHLPGWVRLAVPCRLWLHPQYLTDLEELLAFAQRRAHRLPGIASSQAICEGTKSGRLGRAQPGSDLGALAVSGRRNADFN